MPTKYGNRGDSPRHAPDGYDPKDYWRRREEDRRVRWWFDEQDRARRAREENDRWLRERWKPGTHDIIPQGPRPEREPFYRSPKEEDARERRSPKWDDVYEGPDPEDMKKARRVPTKNDPLGERIRYGADKARRRVKPLLDKIDHPLTRTLDALDLLRDLKNGLNPKRRDLILAGMTRCDGPYYTTPNDYIGWMNIDFNAFHCGQNPDFQLSGQAPGVYWVGEEPDPTGCAGCGIQPLPQPGTRIMYPGGGSTPLTAITYYIYCQPSFVNCTAHRGAEQSSWFRTETVSPWYVDVKAPVIMHTPNMEVPAPILRRLPALTPQPVEQTRPEPAMFVDDIVVTSPVTQRMVNRVPDYWRLQLNVPGVASASQTGGRTLTPPSIPGRPAPTIPSEPPPGRTKQRKFNSRIQRIGILLYNALDVISESADLVDSLYKALPCDVQKRWNRPNRKGADQFGQYGANGADWKAQAIWHNFHKLDVDEAVNNIAWNALEDMLYGMIHRKVPTQAGGPGMEQQWRAFNELLGTLPVHQPKECPK